MTAIEPCPSCPSKHPYGLGHLHDYQVVSRDFLMGRDRAALLLDMGLGKTAASLRALEDRHLPALVVAPKKVAETVWNVEQEIWRPDLELVRAVGEPAARAAALRSEAPIHVISRDNFGKDVAPDWHRGRYKTVIIDELSGYKGRGARWEEMYNFVSDSGVPHVWGLTGSPSPNGLIDLWPQIAILDQGARLGKNITTYKNRYFYVTGKTHTGVPYEWTPKPEAKEHIYALIEDICLAMETEGRIVLPPLTRNKVPIELPPKSRKAYRKFANDLMVDLQTIFGSGEIHSAANSAVLTSKLSQILAGFLYVDDADLRNYEHQILHHEKIDAVKDIIAAPHEGGVLVFYRYTAERAMLEKAIPEAENIDRPGVIDRWNRGEVPVMLAHPASAGHGLNLQHGGHTAVWTSLTWDLEQWDQANKRLFRQGQKWPVVIHLLLGNKSIDHLILGRLGDKTEVQDDLLAYLESPI